MTVLPSDELFAGPEYDPQECPHRSLHFGEQTWWNRFAHRLGLAPLKDWRCRQCGLRMTIKQVRAIVVGWAGK
jgi:hypothetical protein